MQPEPEPTVSHGGKRSVSVSRAKTLATNFGLWYVLLRHQRRASALTEAIAVRLGELLPVDDFETSASGVTIVIQRRRAPSATVGAPALMLASPGSRDERLRRVMQAAGRMVEEQIHISGRMEVQVTEERLSLRWVGDSEEEAVVARMRSIERREVGL